MTETEDDLSNLQITSQMKICTFVIGWPISYNIGTPDNKEVILQHRKEVAMNITERKMLNSKQVAEILGISVSYAYKVIDQLNKELNQAGYLTISGKVDSLYLYKRFFPKADNIYEDGKGEVNATI